MTDLLIRRWRSSDVELARGASLDRSIAGMMDMRSGMGRRAAQNWIARSSGLVIEWGGQAVGEVGLQPDASETSAALWYWVLPPYRGQGLAYRASALVCARARGLILTAFVSERNFASVRILQKLGFQRGERTSQYAGYSGPRDTYTYFRPVPIILAPEMSGGV
ncbi:GNAT family N-acetyltransferase [bacterium]|nr:GNAT family N-acetyltransferase [bacterium]